MSRYLVVGFACVNLVAVNLLIFHKEATVRQKAGAIEANREHVLKSGRTMFLRLRPAEQGSSPIRGDYIVLRYRVRGTLVAEVKEKGPAVGCLVVRLRGDHVAKLVRVHRGEELSEDEHLLRYRLRGDIRLGADSFFFQKGHAKYYERARFGEFRVVPSGRSVLVGLRDRRLGPLGPPGGKE